MTYRRTILTGVAIVVVMMLATALVIRRGDAEPPSAVRALAGRQSASALDCGAIWGKGVELEGMVGSRKSQAYFDMRPAPGNGDEELVSGIVVFPDAQSREALADAVIGLKGQESDDDCDVQFEGDEGSEGLWQLRIESIVHVTGTRRLSDGRIESFVFDIVPETACDGAGEWRTFSDPDWPITFDYPSSWKLTADHDDVNIECPSVTRLAVGGSYLTFERGQFQPPNGKSATENDSSFSEPYWFVKRAGDGWLVKGLGCDPEERPRQPDDCHPARRSERNGMTVLQAAAGEHRLYRPGVGYLGQGAGILRYLWVLGDRWVSLDSTEWSHHDDIGSKGGPVLFDGDQVGDRVVRSVKPR